ncbi:MAG TPA: sortase [Candidatus Saccharimonadales bacterium]|nr:sortase [Candidatus Saccharimonadales bacterium]
MQPEPPNDDRQLQVPSRSDSSARPDSRTAAADYMRREIDRLYEIENEEVSEPEPQATKSKPSVAPADTYKRQHSEAAAHTRKSENQAAYWKRYHSAWQSYYQQYYERYYLTQLRSKQSQPTSQVSTKPADPTEPAIVTGGDGLSRDQAVGELRQQLLGKVSTQAKKVRRSRHFVPLLSAVVIALTVLFLQYNNLIVAQVKAYVSPGSANPTSLIIDPTTDFKVGPEPTVTIPKIGVEAPVVYDVTSLKESYIQNKLKDGVVHYPIPGASSVPGQNGNTVIIGHSSNDVFNSGDYKFIFVQLDRLRKGDIFYLNYKGTRYTYSVTKSEVITPTQINKLVLPQTKPMATLITCTPPGTAWKRLVVYGEQISPDPAKAKPAQEPAGSDTKDISLPTNSPTLLERLFGA